jgi:V8-like Glu-specific endopeptidase
VTLRLATCLLVLALCAGCEPGGEERTTRQAIVGGTPSPADVTVFMLDIHGDNGASTRCSSTLIAPRTLLTAAHCVDPSMLGATRLTIVATNAPTEAEVMPGINTVNVIETRLHPQWNAAAGLGNDLGLALLEGPQTVSPSAWNSQNISGLGGAAIRAVGYGAATPDGGTDTKRTVDLTIRQLTPDLISLGNLVDKGICHGDSGGPTFHTFGDGVERLVGVHSFTRTDDCLDGADTRIDAKAPFVLQWLADKEENCAANLVCATGVCLPVDPDCVALGSACDAPYECRGRQCVNDAQHAAKYCSKTCTTDDECVPGLSCDLGRGLCQLAQLPTARPGEPCIAGATFCTSGSVCNGASADQARCSQPCARTLECLPGQTCKTGFAGGNVCFDSPPVVLPIARVELPAAHGCSAGLGLWTVLGALWLRRRRPA